jgi:predicted P-loop ATPase
MMVICGSVNKNSFLVDETGNRRFWVIPVSDRLDQIDTELLHKERDRIWGEAVRAYQLGESSFLSREEERLCFANNDRFEINDEWQGEVEHYLENRDRVSISEVLLYQLGIEAANQDKQAQMRIASILTRLNWHKASRTMHLGKRQVIWEARKPEEKQKHKSFIVGVPSVPGVTSKKKEPHQPHQTHLLEHFCKNENSQPEKLKGKTPYVHPPNAFEPGERVVHDTIVYKVVDSTHTHVLLEGFKKSIPIWQVERLED